MLWLFVFWWLGWKKRCCIRKMVLGGTLLKVVRAVGFSGKLFFLKCLFSPCHAWCDLVLVICNVHVVIFIKKYLANLFTISFCEFLKILVMPILKTLETLCLILFQKWLKNWRISKKIRTSRPAYEKNAQPAVLGFMITQSFF